MEIPVMVCFLFCFLPIVMAQQDGTESNVITQTEGLLFFTEKEHPAFRRHAVDTYFRSAYLNAVDQDKDRAVTETGKPGP